MAASVRSSGAATSSTTTTSVTVTVPGDVQVGDVVYAVVVNGGANQAPGVVPSGWSLVVSAGTGQGTIVWGGVYRRVWAGGEDPTPTWSGFTNSCTGCCVVVQGADTSSAPERATSARANMSGSGCNGVDANAGDLVLAFAAVDDNAGTTSAWSCATDPTSLTQVRTQASSGGNDTLASIAQGAKLTTGNTGNLSYSVAGSDDNVGLLVAVKSPASAPPSQGSSSGSVSRTGVATGVRVPKGAGSGTVARVGSATGSRMSLGFSAGQVARAGTATGIASRFGSSSGTVVRTGLATGVLPARGSSSGVITRTGSATGFAVHSGSSAGVLTRVGSATGEAPAEGVRQGSSAGTVTRIGTATGAAAHSGSSSGTVTRAGAATGTAGESPTPTTPPAAQGYAGPASRPTPKATAGIKHVPTATRG